MSQAVQGIKPLIVSAKSRMVLANGAQDFVALPTIGFPCKIATLNITPSGPGVGTYIFGVFDVTVTTEFYTSGNVPIADQGFLNFQRAIQAGGFYMTIGGNSFFGNGAGLTLPPLGDISIQVLTPFPPSIVIGIVNNTVGGPETYDIEFGYELIGKGLDLSPEFYPGLGPAGIVSASNI